jgi:hypothetical protein
MLTETIVIRKLTAAEGMTLTNGEAFGKEIYLGCNDSADNWREIADEEAERLQAQAEERGEEK